MADRAPVRRNRTLMLRLSEVEEQHLARAAAEAGVHVADIIRWGIRLATAPQCPEQMLEATRRG